MSAAKKESAHESDFKCASDDPTLLSREQLQIIYEIPAGSKAMKLTLDRAAFAEELRLCGYAVAKRDVIPIMKCVLLRAESGRVGLAATDLDATLTTSIPAEIETEGSCVVEFEVLRRSVAESPGKAISLSLGSDLRLTVTAGAFSMKVPVRSADDFPTIPETPEPQVTAPWATVRDLLSRVTHAISDNDSDGFTLKGAALEVVNGKLAAMATNRHVMSLAEVSGQPLTAAFFSLIQPRICALISQIDAKGDTTIGSDDRFTSFAIGGRVFYSRNNEGRFPKLRSVIPPKEVFAIAATLDIRDAIKRAGVTRGEVLRFDVDRGRIKITAMSTRGETEEKIAADYDGPAFTVAYQAAYIADAIGAIRSDQVMLEFAKTTDGNIPLLLRAEPPEKTDHIEVVMARLYK